jgi:Protein of unknown function (DUF1566)/PKD domain
MNHRNTQASFLPGKPVSSLSHSKSSLRRWAAALICASAVALIAACGGGDGGAESAQSTDPGVPFQISAKIDTNTDNPITGQEVRLSPNVSFTGTIPAGATLTQVRWDFGDNTSVTINNAASFSVAQLKSYAQTGTFTVTLGATASNGASGSVTRTISVQSPPAPFQISAKIDTNTDNPITGQEVRLSPDVSFKGTIPAGATLTEVRWDFGDGASQTINTSASFTMAQFKSYAADGQYTVTLSATASTGESISVTRTISVQSFALTGVLANRFSENNPPNIGDYIRLGADGQPLAIQTATWADLGNNADGTRWECIKDMQSGLIWEVKTKHDPSALRHFASTFTWFDDTQAGQAAGREIDGNFGVCNGVADLAKCNTQAYTVAIKTLPIGQALCGFRDWRMPDRFELLSIVLTTASDPAIRATHFPDVNLARLGKTWSGSTNSIVPELAWDVFFYDGFADGSGFKTDGAAVRLVRSGR